MVQRVFVFVCATRVLRFVCATAVCVCYVVFMFVFVRGTAVFAIWSAQSGAPISGVHLHKSSPACGIASLLVPSPKAGTICGVLCTATREFAHRTFKHGSSEPTRGLRRAQTDIETRFNNVAMLLKKSISPAFLSQLLELESVFCPCFFGAAVPPLMYAFYVSEQMEVQSQARPSDVSAQSKHSNLEPNQEGSSSTAPDSDASARDSIGLMSGGAGLRSGSISDTGGSVNATLTSHEGGSQTGGLRGAVAPGHQAISCTSGSDVRGDTLNNQNDNMSSKGRQQLPYAAISRTDGEAGLEQSNGTVRNSLTSDQGEQGLEEDEEEEDGEGSYLDAADGDFQPAPRQPLDLIQVLVSCALLLQCCRPWQ